MAVQGKGANPTASANDEAPGNDRDEDTKITAVMPVFGGVVGGERDGRKVATVEGRQWAQMPRCRLLVVAGPDAGKSFIPTRDQIVIGSQPSADVVLSDRSVSRFHCEITL